MNSFTSRSENATLKVCKILELAGLDYLNEIMLNNGIEDSEVLRSFRIGELRGMGLTQEDAEMLHYLPRNVSLLESCDLPQYLGNFAKGKISLEKAANLTEQDLINIDIVKVGHRRQILQAVSKMKCKLRLTAQFESLNSWLNDEEPSYSWGIDRTAKARRRPTVAEPTHAPVAVPTPPTVTREPSFKVPAVQPVPTVQPVSKPIPPVVTAPPVRIPAATTPVPIRTPVPTPVPKPAVKVCRYLYGTLFIIYL